MRGTGRGTRVALFAFVAGLAIAVAGGPAEAQRGEGRGHGRQRQAVPREEPAPPGEYRLDGSAAIDAVNRGEGQAALAYYQRTAAQADREGDRLRAARAWHAAAAVAQRLGRYREAIQFANRTVELYKGAGADALAQVDVEAWASACSQLGRAYHLVGDLAAATS